MWDDKPGWVARACRCVLGRLNFIPRVVGYQEVEQGHGKVNHGLDRLISRVC